MLGILHTAHLSVLPFCPVSQDADRHLYCLCHRLRAAGRASGNSWSFLFSQQDNKKFWFLLFLFNLHPPAFCVPRLWPGFMCLQAHLLRTWGSTPLNLLLKPVLSNHLLKARKTSKFQRSWGRMTCICGDGCRLYISCVLSFIRMLHCSSAVIIPGKTAIKSYSQQYCNTFYRNSCRYILQLHLNWPSWEQSPVCATKLCFNPMSK